MSNAEDERKFLHDLASPLSTAIFLTESLLDDLRAREGANPDDALQVGRVYETLGRLKELLQKRREVLINSAAEKK